MTTFWIIFLVTLYTAAALVVYGVLIAKGADSEVPLWAWLLMPVFWPITICLVFGMMIVMVADIAGKK